MLAIVIPYYKIDYFNDTLHSLANQTNKNFKVYIGNDASKDDPSEIIHSILKNVNFKYIKFAENFGSKNLVAQWHRCIDLIDANEEWFMILGDDDFIAIDLVEQFYNNLDEIQNNGSSVVRFAVQKVFDHNISPQKYINPKIQTSNEFFFNRERSSLSEFVFSINSFHKHKFKPIPLAWGADVLVVYELAFGNTIFAINNSTVYVRISEKSISGNSDDKQTTRIKTNSLARVYFYMLKNFEIDKPQRQIIFNKIKKIYLNDKKSIFKLFILLKAFFLIKICE